MLVIDPRIRQMPRTKKPLQHRSLCCSGFLFQQLSINALKIFRLSSFTRNENSGCHCTAQTNLLSGRHTAPVSPSSETAITASSGASVHTSLQKIKQRSPVRPLCPLCCLYRNARRIASPYIGGWLPLKRLSVGRVVYLSYSSRSSTVRRTMPMNTLRSSTTGTKFCSMAAFKSVGMSVVTVTAL